MGQHSIGPVGFGSSGPEGSMWAGNEEATRVAGRMEQEAKKKTLGKKTKGQESEV